MNRKIVSFEFRMLFLLVLLPASLIVMGFSTENTLWICGPSLAYENKDVHTAASYKTDFENSIVVGDAFRIEYYDYLLDDIKSEFKLEGLHNTIQAWIGTPDWHNIKWFVDEAHSSNLPVGSVFGYQYAEAQRLPLEEYYQCFQYYYRHMMDESEKWHYPNGTLAEDPHLVGDTRSFSGGLVWRIMDENSSYSIMQPQNPFWSAFLEEYAKKNIDQGVDSIFLDGIDGSFPMFWNGGWGDNSTWEGFSFIQYLKSEHNQSELVGLGIKNVDAFCLRDYLKDKYTLVGVYGSNYTARGYYNLSSEAAVFERPSTIMEDRIVKDYVVFQYLSMINLTHTIVGTVKSYARSLGRDVLLTANHYMAWFPHIISAPYYDITYLEDNSFLLPPNQRSSQIYKIGLAANGFSKPVWMSEWTLNFNNPFVPSNSPQNISTLLKIQIAEGFASGCVRMIPFGVGSPEEGWPPRRLIMGNEREPVSKYAQFLSAHEGLLKGAKCNAKVAVVLSVPTVIWDYFPALGMYSDRHQSELNGWTRMLEESHVPYDVLMFGVQPIFDDSANLARLGKYDLVVAPDLSCASDEQIQALTTYLNNGGRLLTTSNIGEKDELNSLREPAKLDGLWKSAIVSVVDPGLGSAYEQSVETKSPNMGLFNQMSSHVLNVLPLSGRILTNASADTLISTLTSPNRLTVHLVNYAYDFNSSTDWTAPKQHVYVRVPLPEGFDLKKVTVISPDLPDEIALDFNSTADYAEFVVPDLHVWDIVSLESSRHDVAATKIQPYRNVTSNNTSASISVTTTNQGDATESFNVTLYVNNTAIETQTVNNLPNGSSTNQTFTWNTSGFDYGNYTLSFYAWPVPKETDTTDNTLVSWTVVTIPGDIDGNLKVQLNDLVLLAQAYGSNPADLKWYPNSDIDGNNVVGLSDLFALAQHYGQQYP